MSLRSPDVRSAVPEVVGELARHLAVARRPLSHVACGGQPLGEQDHAVVEDGELVVLDRGLFRDTFNRRDLSAIDRVHAPNVRWHGTTNREGYGRAAVRGMARALLATFPDLGLHVDEVYWMGNEADGFRVSVRWTATGTYRGHALCGEPTGRRVHLWGGA